MALVEVTFVKVEGLMFELSRDRQRYDQLLNEVQCSASTSGSSVLPSAGGPEMILLKSRVEKMSREISDLNGSVCGVRQAVAVVEDSVLSKEVKLNELVMQTAHQTTQAAVQLVAEREQILCNQIECVIMEVSKGACQCPSGCPGQAVSHQADLPSINGAGCPGGGRAPFFGLTAATTHQEVTEVEAQAVALAAEAAAAPRSRWPMTSSATTATTRRSC